MADVILSNKILDVDVQRVLESFLAVGDASFRLQINKRMPSGDRQQSDWTMQIHGKTPVENYQDYGERMLRSLGIMVLRAYDKYLDEKDKYQPAIAAINPPAHDVPDDIIQ